MRLRAARRPGRQALPRPGPVRRHDAEARRAAAPRARPGPRRLARLQGTLLRPLLARRQPRRHRPRPPPRRARADPPRLRPLVRRHAGSRRPRRARLHDPAPRLLRGARGAQRAQPAHAAVLHPGRLDPRGGVPRHARHRRDLGGVRRRARRRGRRRARRRDAGRAAWPRGRPLPRGRRALAARLVARRRMGPLRHAQQRPPPRRGTAAPGPLHLRHGRRDADRELARRATGPPGGARGAARLEPARDVHQLADDGPAAPSRGADGQGGHGLRRREAPARHGAVAGRLLRLLPRVSLLPRLHAAAAELPQRRGPLRGLPEGPPRPPRTPGRDDHRVRRADRYRLGAPRTARARPGRPLRAGGGPHGRRHARGDPAPGDGRRAALLLHRRVVQAHLEHDGPGEAGGAPAAAGTTRSPTRSSSGSSPPRPARRRP